jgi:hypothetical protein
VRRDGHGWHARDACRRGATATIPMIFNIGVDPVQFGLAASHSRPGGNLTGLAILSADLAAKKLEVLHELLPDASVVAMLVNPANPSVEPESKATQDAARSLGVQFHILRASTAGEIDAAFASLAKLRARALVVSDDSYFLNQRAQVKALAARGNRLADSTSHMAPADRLGLCCAQDRRPLLGHNIRGFGSGVEICQLITLRRTYGASEFDCAVGSCTQKEQGD